MSENFLNKKIREMECVNKKGDIFSFFLSRTKKYDEKVKAFLEVLNYKEAIPYGLKDNILCIGAKTTCGSQLLKNYNSTYDATVVENLRKYGFEPLGKTNMDEFAMGSSTENSSFFPTRNPWNTERIPGGSSGGSAAAVASGLVPFALGSDTGGSIRLPAAMCGIVGYKPSYGLVSRYGLVAFGSSLDQIGPFTRCIEDTHSVIKMIASKDEKDSTSENFEIKDLATTDLKKIRIAIPREMVDYEGLDEGVKESFYQFVEELEKNGVKINYVNIPSLKYVIATYYLIAPGEASSNLSRFDGVRYGKRNDKSNYEDMVNLFRDSGFGIEVKRRILLGTFTLSSAYYDAYYRKALKVRRIIKKEIDKIFENNDFIVNPTSPVIAPYLNQITDPLTYYLMDYYTISANLTGAPAISLPIKRVENMPVGLHIMSKRFMDNELLSFAKQIQNLSPSFKNGFFELPDGGEKYV